MGDARASGARARVVFPVAPKARGRRLGPINVENTHSSLRILLPSKSKPTAYHLPRPSGRVRGAILRALGCGFEKIA